MAGEVLLDVVTPARRVLSETAEFVVLPGADGELGVLHNHAAMIAGLSIGVLRYGPIEGEKHQIFISGGFAEVVENKVTVLADAAELAEEIDVMRAKAAKERAEHRLRDKSEHLDFHRAQLAMQRAITRLKVAGEDYR
jgi:F-type H+-transporting ATPase subunit epsilon